MLKIIEKTKIWFIASAIIILVGMTFWIVKGLNLGTDFAGGTIMQVDLKKQVNTEEIRSIAAQYLKDAQVSTADVTGITIRSTAGTSDAAANVEKLKAAIDTKYNIDPTAWTTEIVGPTIGRELAQKAVLALLIAFAAMLIYVGIRFEFKFGVAAILALVHDLLITMTVYAVLQIPVNSSFIAAVLTIVGYSINDTIVIFDRIRENMKLMRNVSIEELADVSITQTMSRSINTILTVLFTITSVYFIGVSAVKELALPLIIGIISGCYSSVFIASPFWAIFKNAEKRKVAGAKA